MEENEKTISNNSVDETAKNMRTEKLNNYVKEVQDKVVVAGKFLRDTYYPGLSADEIGQRIELLENIGLTPDMVINEVKAGNLDLSQDIKELENNAKKVIENKIENKKEENPTRED